MSHMGYTGSAMMMMQMMKEMKGATREEGNTSTVQSLEELLAWRVSEAASLGWADADEGWPGQHAVVKSSLSLSPCSWTLPSLCPAGVREPQWEHIIGSSFLCIPKLRKGLWSWQRALESQVVLILPQWVSSGPQFTPLVRGYWSVSLGSQGSQRSKLPTGFLRISGWLK